MAAATLYSNSYFKQLSNVLISCICMQLQHKFLRNNNVRKDLKQKEKEGTKKTIWLSSDYYLLSPGPWYEEIINSRNRSVFHVMKWNADGQRICIVYGDGTLCYLVKM